MKPAVPRATRTGPIVRYPMMLQLRRIENTGADDLPVGIRPATGLRQDAAILTGPLTMDPLGVTRTCRARN